MTLPSKDSRQIAASPYKTSKCERQELNLHGFPHWILRPIPVCRKALYVLPLRRSKQIGLAGVWQALHSGRFADSFGPGRRLGLLADCPTLLSGVCPSASRATRTPFLLATLGFAAVCPSVWVSFGRLPPGAHGGAGDQCSPSRLGYHG
jgi:hypothetical protein